MKKENSISRRSFLKSTAMAGALGAIGTGSASVLTSCAGGGESATANKPLKEPGTYYIPELPDKATDGKELKAGIIGCGGRGSGAAENFLDAANGVTVVAVADTFKERVDALADKLKEKGYDKVCSLHRKPNLLLSTILITNNFVNVGIVIISTYLVNSLFNFSSSPVLGFIIQVILVTFLILLFGTADHRPVCCHSESLCQLL